MQPKTQGKTVTPPVDRREGSHTAANPTGFRPSDRHTGGPLATTADRPPCCNGSEGTPLNHLIPATLHLLSQAHDIHVLIDTGCLQVNIISAKIAALLAKDGGLTYGTNIVLTAGV